MSFGSMTFLFGFLPAVLLCYFLIPARFRTGRNFILLLFSLAFYGWGGVRLLPVLVSSDWMLLSLYLLILRACICPLLITRDF